MSTFFDYTEYLDINNVTVKHSGQRKTPSDCNLINYSLHDE